MLRRVEEEGAYSSLLMQHLDDEGLGRRDIGLLTELVYGVLRRRDFLDHVITRFSSRPIAFAAACVNGSPTSTHLSRLPKYFSSSCAMAFGRS